MIRNYIKTALVNIKKNILFSGINIFGLAISMSIGILMILLLSDLYSFDNFHTQKDRIYKVTTKRVQGIHNQEVKLSSSSFFIENEIKTKIPSVEYTTITKEEFLTADLKSDQYSIPIKGLYASHSFFDVFSFKLKKGNPKTVLSSPNAIVLTELTAKKLFGEKDAIGQIVTVDNNTNFKEGIVTGIVEDPPINSFMQFEALVSLNTLNIVTELQEPGFKENPGRTSDNTVYIVLNEKTKKEEVESTMAEIMSGYNKSIEHPITHTLQPLNTFVTSNDYINLVGPSFSQSRIYIMIGLALIILLSACFNYTNLSLARALKRSKEVAVRKITGATNVQVFSQFIVEAILLTLIALVISFGLFYVIKSEFLNLSKAYGNSYNIFSLKINLLQCFYFLLFAIIIGSVAGFFPALMLSKFKTKNALNDASKLKVFAGLKLRKVLTVFQFIISIGLITSAVMVHKQYVFSLNYDLGYTTDQIVNINIEGDYAHLLENEFNQIPEVVETSKSSMLLGVGGKGIDMAMTKPEGKNNRVPFMINHIGNNYMNMHKFKFLAGSEFKAQLKAGENPNHIIINEGFLKELNLGKPEEAIGKFVAYKGEQLQIVGVVEDFISIALTKKLFPSFAFIPANNPEQYNTLSVKVKGGNMVSTLNQLETIYKKHDLTHAFKADFYDDQIAQVYQGNKATYTIITFLAFLAISISTLGLLGMAVFTTERRMKEISIRKVLGANIKSLAILLSRGFIIMIGIAALISIPVTNYIVDKKVLNEFLYRVDMSAIDIFSGFLIVSLIAILTIGSQIWRTINKNPANTLRNE